MSTPHGLLGLIEIARSRPEDAIKHFEQALALNPSLAPAHAQIGRMMARTGRAKEGLDHIRYAIRLSPKDPLMPYWLAFAGYAELELGHYQKAAAELSRAHALNPDQARTTLTLVAALAMAGDLTKARTLLAKLQAERPHLTSESIAKRYQSDPELRASESAKGIMRALDADL